MTFVSVEFLLFLPTVFAVYFLLPERWRNFFLLASGCFFYAAWYAPYLLLLLATTGADFLLARHMGRTSERGRRVCLWISVVSNLTLLVGFKSYHAVRVLNLPGTLSLPWTILLPIGISFYTFHALSYTIDVYRRKIQAEDSFVVYFNYILFFPQLVAGPIARASQLLPQFRTPRKLRWENLTRGSYLMVRGYLWKVIFADSIGSYVDATYWLQTPRPWESFQVVYLFAFQIYFDFLGYTLIARGVAKLFDVDLVENFRRPYSSASFGEFWRRWHISLSEWLRDYVYIPLGGSRGGAARTYVNLLLTMALCGFWHGAKITFVLWGTLHGVFLLAERAAAQTGWGRWLGARCPRLVRVALVFHGAAFAFVLFRAKGLVQAGYVLRQYSACVAHPRTYFALESQRGLWFLVAAAMVYEWAEDRFRLETRYAALPWGWRATLVYGALTVTCLGAELNPTAFIYFQF